MTGQLLTKEILEQLSEPFPNEAIEWKPQAFNRDKTRALAIPYITSRHVMGRLDEVVGPAGWEYDFEPLPDGSTKGKLTVLGITKCDKGFVSGEDDAGLKGSVSDGLKRAAVLFGIGRYLYEAEQQWLGWDDKYRKFTEHPQLKLKGGVKPSPQVTGPEKEGPLIKAALEMGGEIAQPQAKHWIEYETARKRFWAWTGESLGLTDDEVHTALGVKSVKDYPGSMSKAKATIEQWLANQMGEEEIPF